MIPTPHNYSILLERWRALAKRNLWTLTELCSDDQSPVIAIENEAARTQESGGLYLSAGVHGDECAPVWALLQWAETLSPENPLGNKPLVLLPCLNPHGLIENTRVDSKGNDLNRNFQNRELPISRAWQDLLDNRKFDGALNLHEDYDANGIYLYELSRAKSIGHTLLDACSTLIPRESAAEIDGHPMNSGLLKRSEDIERVANEDLGGWPEAIYLYLKHQTSAYTFETPSELDLDCRIDTHRRFIESFIQLKFS